MAYPTRFAGQFNAADFAYGINKTSSAMIVTNGPNATGAGTLTVAFGYTTLPDGTVINPLNVNAKIEVGAGAGWETVTPTSVSTSTPTQYGTSTVTATFSNLHGNGDQIRSGTCGLQEALNYASTYGGGVVIVDAGWTALGGTTTILNAATIPVGVAIQDNRLAVGPVQSVSVPLTLAQIQNAFTTSVQIVAAAGTGTMIDVIDAVIDLVFGTNAFTSGGAAQLSYSTGVTYPATATVAASVYTGLAANTIQKVAGAAVASTSSNYLNKGIYYANATGAFTAGTGCSGNVVVNYKVISGLS
jgi:hypothetical protein